MNGFALPIAEMFLICTEAVYVVPGVTTAAAVQTSAVGASDSAANVFGKPVADTRVSVPFEVQPVRSTSRCGLGHRFTRSTVTTGVRL